MKIKFFDDMEDWLCGRAYLPILVADINIL